MQIIFDHQIFNLKYGGAPKYFSKLLKYLPDSSWQCTSLHPFSEYLREDGLMNCYNQHFKYEHIFWEIVNRPYSYYRLNKGDYDIYHQTNFSVKCLDCAKHKPIVTTYHDSNLSTIDPHPKIVEWQKKSLERADAIICVSENTKRDMLNIFDVDENKVKVIYHGIENVEMANLPQKRIIEEKYILYVGRRSAYKNFKVMALAFANVYKQIGNIKLVCTSDPFTTEEHLLFRNLGIDNAIVHIGASEKKMQQLYRDAEVFIFPSLYEGFGMPILEAWQCNCPVILSKASCFPEIASDAALYFSADDYFDLASKIQQILTNGRLRDNYIKKGKIRVQKFSWESCAQQHYELYQSLL